MERSWFSSVRGVSAGPEVGVAVEVGGGGCDDCGDAWEVDGVEVGWIGRSLGKKGKGVNNCLNW